MWPTRLKTTMLWAAVLLIVFENPICGSIIKGQDEAERPAEVHSKKPQNDPSWREILSQLPRIAGLNETNSTDTIINNERELKSDTYVLPFEVPDELQGGYELIGDEEMALGSDEPAGDPKPPRIITVIQNFVTVSTRRPVDHENRRPVRAVPPTPATGRNSKVNDYHALWLATGQTKHMVFEVPLTRRVPFGPTTLELVSGRRCVHLFWTSANTMSFWTTDVSADRQACNPDDWSGDAVVEHFGKRPKRENPDDAPGAYRYARISA